MNALRSRHGLTTTALLLLAVLFASFTFGAGGLFPRSATASAVEVGGETAAAGRAATAAPDKAKQVRVTEAYGKLPMSFEANSGQTDARVKFLARGDGYSLFLTPSEAVLSLSKPAARETGAKSQDVLRMKLANANPSPRVVGVEQLPGKSNYLRGNDPRRWRTDVAHYARVRYESVYRGVDLVFYGNQRQLEYDFIIAAGADPSSITLAFEGARSVEIDAGGDLVLHTKGGAVRQRKPVIYQESDGARHELSGRYVKKGKRRVGFEVGPYDLSRPLVIDPVLVYSTFLGGVSSEVGNGVAVDGAGHAYIVGETGSTNFPATPGALDTTSNSTSDVFVTKLDVSGSALVYSTYLGGNVSDEGTGVAVDAAGHAFVTGGTSSTDFPTTPGAFDTSFNGNSDAFVAKLEASGAGLIYSTYLGGNGIGEQGFTNELAHHIAVDAAGNAYVTGETPSSNFPTTPGAFDTTFNSVTDAFVTKLNASGSALVYSTYLGGATSIGGRDVGFDIAVDAAGNAYVTGETTASNFPTTTGVLDSSFNGRTDGFVTKVNTSGTALLYSTFLGGSENDRGNGIAIDGAGHAYVTGYTGSTNFPTTPGAFDTSYGGDGNLDAFVTKLNDSGSALVYSTFLGGGGGGNGGDVGYSIVVDGAGNAYVTGETSSPNFPTTQDAFDAFFGGSPHATTPSDAFVTKLNAAGTALLYSTFLGGNNTDRGQRIVLDPAGNAYVAGDTRSPDFPVTTGAFDTSFSGGVNDAFITKIGEALPTPTPTPTPTPCPAVVVHPQVAPGGTVGAAYGLNFAATGGGAPYTFNASGTLPAGLSLSAGTGQLAGTPTSVGVFNFTVVAIDADGCAGGAAYTVTVNPAPTPTPTPTPQANTWRIAFETGRDGNSEIYLMDADGRNPTRLTNNGARDGDPFFSPLGSRIVFPSNRDGNYEIYVMNVDGTNQTRLTSNAADDFRPAFSPDGSKIVFYRSSGSSSEIYVMNADGTNQVRLTNNSSADMFPKWSPDGSKLVFHSDRDGDFDIYTMNVDGSNVVKLTNNNSSDNEASFSPDGTKVVFASDRTGNTEVWVMSADGSNPVNLSNSSNTDGSCSWSADGKKVLFVSGRDGNTEVYSMNPDGTGQTRLTVNNASENTPVSGVVPRVNHAASSNGGTVTASSTTPDTEFPGLTFPASGVINGDRKGLNWEHGGGWRDGTNNAFPDWVEVQFAGVRTVEEVNVFSLQDNYASPSEPTETTTCTLYCLQDFDVEYWNGAGWAVVPGGQVVNNNLVWRRFVFPALSTNRIRVLVKRAAAGRSRVVEVEAY